MLDDLERLNEQLSGFDLVIVCGDLTKRGAPEELVEARKILDEVMAAAAKPTSPPRLLVVPGNHDLVRPGDPSPEASRMLRRWLTDPSVREEFWSDPSSPPRRFVDRAFEPFERWWQGMESPETPRDRKAHAGRSLRRGLLPGDFTVTIKKGNHRLGVAGLNSAFLQTTGDDYEGRIAIDPHQMEMAAGGDVPSWIAEHDAAILVTHHAPDWLADELKTRYETAIYPRGRFCAHLCAHLHEPSRPVSEKDSRRWICSPSFFGLETWLDRRGKRRARELGYVAASLDFEDQTLDVFARRFVRDDLVCDAPLSLPAALSPRLKENRAFRLELATLRDALAASRPDPREPRRLARALELDLGPRQGGAAPDVWHAVLAEAEHQKKLPALIEACNPAGQPDSRVSDAWAVYQRADEARSSLPVDIRAGSTEQRLSDVLYEHLVDMQPAAFESVVKALGIVGDIPGETAPQTARAIAIVQICERDGMPGLERLLAAVLHALGRKPAPAMAEGDELGGDTWLPMLLLLLGGLAAGVGIGLLVSDTLAKKEPRRRVVTKASVANLMNAMFLSDREFDGFVLEHFPAVYRSFTNGMNRAYRIRLLLERAPPADIVAKLKRGRPSAFSANERTLDYTEQAGPSEGAQASRNR